MKLLRAILRFLQRMTWRYDKEMTAAVRGAAAGRK
jgi:hypothetical protein